MSLLYLFSALVFLSSLCIVNKVGFSMAVAVVDPGFESRGGGGGD